MSKLISPTLLYSESFDFRSEYNFEETKQTDPVFYCEGDGHVLVATLLDTMTNHEIGFYCDGDMRLVINEEIINDKWKLINAGINTDKDLQDLEPIMWQMNPWFDMYLHTSQDDINAGWLNRVHFDITKEGIPLAHFILLELRNKGE